MSVLRAFRYGFEPAAEQATLLRHTFGCVRLVDNEVLHERSQAWTRSKKSVGDVAQSAALTAWKKSDDLWFLNRVSSVPLQQSLPHLQTASKIFLQKRARYSSANPRHDN